MSGLGLSPRIDSPRRMTDSPGVRGQDVSAHVRLRAPPQPGVTDASKLTSSVSASGASGARAGSLLMTEGDLKPKLSGVAQPRRSLEPGAVRLASTRVNGQPCKTMSAADSLAGSLSDDASWRSRTTVPGDCVKNSANMLPRRSRLTQMILSGPQRSPAMSQMVASDAALADPLRRIAAPPRPISSGIGYRAKR